MYMVSWDIAIALIVLAFVLPFVFLWAQVASSHRMARNSRTEADQLRRHSRDLEHHLENDKSLFLEALGVPFLLIRSSGRQVMANSAAQEIMPMDISRNPNLCRMLPDGDLRDFITQAASIDRPLTGNLSFKVGDQERTFRTTATPLGNRDRHIGIVFLDVTEELRTMIIRRDFVANASHELRTPLTIIQGYLETLLEDAQENPEDANRAHMLGVMEKHMDRIVHLVEDMLTISRLEHIEHRKNVSCESFELDELVSDVRQRLESMLAVNATEMEVDLQPSPFTLCGDRFYWSQILFNLLENSLKNNPHPGLHLRVIARELPDNQLSIAVEDDGVGIGAEHLPYIFNRFYRADTTGRVKGTGLGLSIVRHAIEAQGGTITAQSTPGVCTRFEIRVPAARA